MIKSYSEHITRDCNLLFADYFPAFDYIIFPSRSCVLTQRIACLENSMENRSPRMEYIALL
ncbi:MAG: hypothetical protein ACOH2A_07105 [Sphingobacteriaceae bacterium]